MPARFHRADAGGDISVGIERRFSFQHLHQTEITRYQANTLLIQFAAD
jgi:hypothetical protein